ASTPDTDGLNRAILSLRESSDLPAVVAAANAAVRLEGFHALLPSMDEIFIKTVETSNLQAPIR
ncbi:MAG: DUF4162 domain-containing protein, partial [Muribaculaceae bacterium]|nr:DUF4162 domain-containing protein [Muribaculaceae bacterium]